MFLKSDAQLITDLAGLEGLYVVYLLNSNTAAQAG